MTVDQLESELRCLGILNREDLRTCTLEINGKIGYEKKKEKDVLTYSDFVTLMNLDQKAQILQANNKPKDKKNQNMFDEVRDHHDNNTEKTMLD